MIIDDDIHIGNIIKEALIKEDYQVSRAYSGTEALYVLSASKPDLILLDLMLPGLSGEEVLPQIKDIPVIVISAKIDIDDKVELLLGGAADYITKPFSLAVLRARVATQLHGQSPGIETVRPVDTEGISGADAGHMAAVSDNTGDGQCGGRHDGS